MSKVLICDSDTEFTGQLQKVFDQQADAAVSVTARADQATEIAAREDTRLVVFGPSVPIERALEIGAELTSRVPMVGVLLVARTVTTDLLRRAMRVGLTDAIPAEESTYGEVFEAIEQALDAVDAARAGTEGGSPASRPSRLAKTMTVFSTKGGVGKTVIAGNLAVALSTNLGKRTVLVDLDLEAGDVGVTLRLEPKQTIYDAAEASDRLDADLMRGFLTRHPASGLSVLLAPRLSDQAESVTAPRIARVIDVLQGMFDSVVIDTPGTLNEAVLTAIDKSHLVLAVATLDMPSLKNTVISLRRLGQLGYGTNRVKVVLNRADSKVLLSPGDVPKSVGSDVLAEIPSDRLFPRSVNKGVPALLEAPRSAVAKSLLRLADAVNGTELGAQQR